MKWMFKEDHSLGKGGVILIRVIKTSTHVHFMDWGGFHFVLCVMNLAFNDSKTRLLNATDSHTGLSFRLLFEEEGALLASCVDTAQALNVAVNS